MDEAKYLKSKMIFEMHGGKMESSLELDKYLDKRGADAITLTKDLIIFKHGSPPTTTEFFEELIHTSQFIKDKVSTDNITELEIETKEKLIKYQKQYNIPDHENKQTLKQVNNLKIILAKKGEIKNVPNHN